MKPCIPMISLLCLVTLCQLTFGMGNQAESKEAKPHTSSTSTSSGIHEHQKQTRAQDNVDMFKKLLQSTLHRFREHSAASIIVSNLPSDTPVAYDAAKQTFLIDPRIADTKFFPINGSDSSNKTIPPAYQFYAYWLTRQHLNAVRKSKDSYLDTLHTTLKYLLIDKHHGAVLYATLKNIQGMINNQQRSDNSLPTHQEEYNSIIDYLDTTSFRFEEPQALKQPNNAMLITLSLSASIVRKDGTTSTLMLHNTGFTLQNVTPSNAPRVREILTPKCRRSSSSSQNQTLVPTNPLATHKTNSLACLFTLFSRLFGQC